MFDLEVEEDEATHDLVEPASKINLNFLAGKLRQLVLRPKSSDYHVDSPSACFAGLPDSIDTIFFGSARYYDPRSHNEQVKDLNNRLMDLLDLPELLFETLHTVIIADIHLPEIDKGFDLNFSSKVLDYSSVLHKLDCLRMEEIEIRDRNGKRWSSDKLKTVSEDAKPASGRQRLAAAAKGVSDATAALESARNRHVARANALAKLEAAAAKKKLDVAFGPA